jgi:hypothetical protein
LAREGPVERAGDLSVELAALLEPPLAASRLPPPELTELQEVSAEVVERGEVVGVRALRWTIEKNDSGLPHFSA